MRYDNAALVRRLKNNDTKAFEMIVEQYSRFVAGIVFNVSGGSLSIEDIEETVADVFITLWKNADKVMEGKLQGYLCSIAKTRTYDKLSGKKPVPILDIDEIDPEDNFDIMEQAEKKDIAQELMSAVNEIGEPDREILLRHYFYYQKISDIARIMNMNPDTVKVKLHRTRNRLKKMLTERGFLL